MFGYSKVIYINEERYLHFKSKCKPKESAKPLDCLKMLMCLFTPCNQVLIDQINNKNVAVADPLANYTLFHYGFELIGSYVKWFDTE